MALLPNADVIVNWFHVIQAVNKELKQLKNPGKKAQPEAFKGAHYALLKNQQDLVDLGRCQTSFCLGVINHQATTGCGFK